MTKAYYLRNEQETAEGYPAKSKPLPNALELIKAGKEYNRGYVPGDKLVLVNDKPEIFNEIEDENLTDIQIAETMFSLYNRKGFGDEREFAGPSMSVGDLVVLICQNSVTLLQCASVGFVVVNDKLVEAGNADDLFEALPIPEMAVLALTLSRRA
jgi:hypothetical protein